MKRYDMAAMVRWADERKAIETYKGEGFRMSINGLPFFKEMEELRRQMVESAESLGMSHPTVLKYSQQLDEMYTLSMRQRYFQYKGQK